MALLGLAGLAGITRRVTSSLTAVLADVEPGKAAPPSTGSAISLIKQVPER